MAKRLTIHLKNVQKVEHKGKKKLFNTVSRTLTTGSEKEINDILRNAGEVQKHYVSNIRA